MEEDHMLLRPPDHEASRSLPSPLNEHQQHPPASLNTSCALLPPSYGPGHSHCRHPEPQPQSHDPASLVFPPVPSTELAPIQPQAAPPSTRPQGQDGSLSNILPSISALTDSLCPLVPAAAPCAPTSTCSSAQASTSSPDPTTTASPPEQARSLRLSSPTRINHWPSLNPLTTYYTPSHALPVDSPGKMDVEMSDTRAGSVSLDDPDVRMAAEALGDLRADFVTTTPHHNQKQRHPSQEHNHEPEPLLQLLTMSHPLLAKTIEGTTSAYNTSKNFSPRFKSGAEYVEGYLTPIGNTLGSVGRVTGVEGGVRWFLRGARRQPSSSDLESGDGTRNKRRKMGNGSATGSRTPIGDNSSNMPGVSTSVGSPRAGAANAAAVEFDPFAFSNKERRTSMSTVDTLPAYDDHRSPAYTEAENEGSQVGSPAPSGAPAAWQSRLIMSTSGLSIAMSEESLRSLKYCLQWLRWANNRIAKVISTLKATLEQFEQQQQADQTDSSSSLANVAQATSSDAMAVDDAQPAQGENPDNGEFGYRVAVLKSEVLNTLRAVIDTVSKYAGGALPENARVLVRRHLTSLPQRFRLASQADTIVPASAERQANEKEVREGAQRVLVLAQEGLDMMAQVSGVLDGTIVSAEEWCARLGKKKQEEREAMARQQLEPLTGVGIDGDVKMG